MVEAAEKYFSNDYQGFDKDGNVMMDKAAYIGMTQLMMKAFPDFKGVVHDLREEDGDVIMTFHWEGTHTDDFDLSAMGLGVIPASGKKATTPESKTRFMVEGGKIVGNQPISGGFEPFLASLRVEMSAG
jgi:hypothetical protein